MARKKKEEIKEELATPSETATIATDLEATVAVEEKANEKKPNAQKKVVKATKTSKKSTKKTERKEKQEKDEQTAQEAKSEPVQEEVAKEPTEKNETTAKPKRGRKVTAKKEKPVVEASTSNAETDVDKVDGSPAEKGQGKPKKTVTRAEKNETIKSLIKELLSKRPYKWSELLDESGRLYEQKIEEKDGHVANDVRGRVGSVFDVMKKDGEVIFEGGMYALKRVFDKKKQEQPLPLAEEVKPQPESKEKSTKKQENLVPAPLVASEENTTETLPKKVEVTPVFDLSLLLGDKTEKAKQAKSEKPETIQKADEQVKTEEKPEVKTTVKQPKKQEKPERKKSTNEPTKGKRTPEKRATRAQGNKLKEAFLKKIRTLGGKYFEYYSIYLLERYSLRNGRRVDGFKVSGGDNDGGIDGEIEVTDRIGFKETIYIQAKNWKPIYGKEDSWVIGETALREFIGAVAYRQAKEGKQHCRGIFITTSYFTAGSKEILEKMSDSFVGYDGDDLFETAKECSFGLIEKDGEWQLDEKLLAGDKAFFNLCD